MGLLTYKGPHKLLSWNRLSVGNLEARANSLVLRISDMQRREEQGLLSEEEKHVLCSTLDEYSRTSKQIEIK